MLLPVLWPPNLPIPLNMTSETLWLLSSPHECLMWQAGMRLVEAWRWVFWILARVVTKLPHLPSHFLRQGSFLRTSTEVIWGFATQATQVLISPTNGPEKEEPVWNLANAASVMVSSAHAEGQNPYNVWERVILICGTNRCITPQRLQGLRQKCKALPGCFLSC